MDIYNLPKYVDRSYNFVYKIMKTVFIEHELTSFDNEEEEWCFYDFTSSLVSLVQNT